ncbi:ATP-binding protein [Kribbella sp. NPDC003505]|uniref:AlbA family DNA-binding domain-containing protein n=1 Tax=Kribbella sp. NPDC003505 TaxID=3154448 RepID=UPI0033B0E0B0
MPRWRPSTEKELLAAIEDGLLRETHYLDMKRETGSSSGERKETARDLSSFAVDGGALLVGVEEDKENRTWRLRPQPLEGLAEKLEQIATQLVDPPLFITADEIPAEADASTGYLFVQVPGSARAPHMVEGIYYGRGDRTRIRLSDAEVVRHHASREPLESLVTR